MEKPRSLSEYYTWAATALGSDFVDPRAKRIYEVNLRSCFNKVSEHDFFIGLQSQLEQWEREYQSLTNTGLLMASSPPELLLKPFESAVDKSFRVNILWNEKFPEPPRRGWATTANLHHYFNDLIRCSVTCRFIDGPDYVTRCLLAYAKELALERRRYSQERDEGYYAYHYYVSFPVRLLDTDWEEYDAEIEVEIQVTTQLQDVLRSLTHSFYRQDRVASDQDSSRWKWEFKSNRFRVGYLSHALHLLESVIVESRDELAEQLRREEKGTPSNNDQN